MAKVTKSIVRVQEVDRDIYVQLAELALSRDLDFSGMKANRHLDGTAGGQYQATIVAETTEDLDNLTHLLKELEIPYSTDIL